MDDVARHQIDKTDMGDNRLMGVLVCQVVKNYDKDHQGAVLVNITTRDYQESKLVWARMALPYGGQKWGEYFIPEVGDQVLVVFEQGNIDRPFIIGAVPKLNSNFMQQAFDEGEIPIGAIIVCKDRLYLHFYTVTYLLLCYIVF